MNEGRCELMMEKRTPEIDDALNRLNNIVEKTGGIATAYRNLLSNELEGKEPCPTQERRNTIAEALREMANRLTYQNERMEELLKQLSEKVGEVKII